MLANGEEFLLQIQNFAETAHGSQKRKYTGEPYIVHPVRVMQLCKVYTKDIATLASALLHDVLEDTPVTQQELQAFLVQIVRVNEAQEICLLTEELTDVFTTQSYPELNRKQRKQKEAERLAGISSKAETVKYANIIDNCLEISIYDPAFGKIFIEECKFILQNMNRGQNELYQRALQTIN